MRRKKHKHTRRSMAFYRVNYGFREPFKVCLLGGRHLNQHTPWDPWAPGPQASSRRGGPAPRQARPAAVASFHPIACLLQTLFPNPLPSPHA